MAGDVGDVVILSDGFCAGGGGGEISESHACNARRAQGIVACHDFLLRKDWLWGLMISNFAGRKTQEQG